MNTYGTCFGICLREVINPLSGLVPTKIFIFTFFQNRLNFDLAEEKNLILRKRNKYPAGFLHKCTRVNTCVNTKYSSKRCTCDQAPLYNTKVCIYALMCDYMYICMYDMYVHILQILNCEHVEDQNLITVLMSNIYVNILNWFALPDLYSYLSSIYILLLE